MACITIEYGGLVFGDPTPDANNVIWHWTSLDGWWLPPDPVVNTIELDDGEEVCSVFRDSRHVSMGGYADTQFDDVAYGAALATLDTLDVVTPVPFVVNTATPMQIVETYVADVLKPTRKGERKGFEFEIQLFCPNPHKTAV